MMGPRWAPPGQVARSCRTGGYGMCDGCDEWGDLELDAEDSNFAVCVDCKARFERMRLKERLRGGQAEGAG